MAVVWIKSLLVSIPIKNNEYSSEAYENKATALITEEKYLVASYSQIFKS